MNTYDMSITSQQIEVRELLVDIKHLNQVTMKEVGIIGDQISLQILKEQLPEETADALIGGFSKFLGQISAKTKLTEKAILSMQNEISEKENSYTSLETIDSQSTDFSFTARQLAVNKNFLPVERSENGIDYCWSGDDSQLRFLFSIDRKEALEMQIRIFALIMPEYSNKLKILIDGKYIKHRFFKNGPIFVVSCNLPHSNITTQTEVKVILPGTHSPMELGASGDARTLGIAVTEICFQKPSNGFTRLLHRLKLKK